MQARMGLSKWPLLVRSRQAFERLYTRTEKDEAAKEEWPDVIATETMNNDADETDQMMRFFYGNVSRANTMFEKLTVSKEPRVRRDMQRCAHGLSCLTCLVGRVCLV